MRRLWTGATLAGLCAMAACSSSPAATHPGGPSSRAGIPATLSATGRAPATSSAPARPGTSGAVPAAPAPPQVTVTRMRTADGSVVTVATFAGPVTYVLHDGSEDPGAAAGRVQAGPVVAGAERKRLLAAFNGGFKLSAGVGGYEQEGHVASALRPGLASLVIARSGQARIGVWGHGVPAPGEAVYSVRQNLTALVLNGKPTAAARSGWSAKDRVRPANPAELDSWATSQSRSAWARPSKLARPGSSPGSSSPISASRRLRRFRYPAIASWSRTGCAEPTSATAPLSPASPATRSAAWISWRGLAISTAR